MPPTEIQSGKSSSRSRGSVSERNRSRPGLARPIAFNIPYAVSAMRGGAFPSRGNGVIVFVTNPSSWRATSGATSASRQPDALSSNEDRSFYAKPFELAADLDRAPVAAAVAARHRRFPRELRARALHRDGLQHRLRPAREDVLPRRDQLGDERRVDRELG